MLILEVMMFQRVGTSSASSLATTLIQKHSQIQNHLIQLISMRKKLKSNSAHLEEEVMFVLEGNLQRLNSKSCSTSS
ncbi:unnamed protein product [Calypogeia fissa]